MPDRRKLSENGNPASADVGSRRRPERWGGGGYDRGSRLRLVGQMDRLWTDDDVPDQADYWVGRVQSIRRFTSRDKDTRAPYKPLLLLWHIGRVAKGLPERVSFTKAELQAGPSTEQ